MKECRAKISEKIFDEIKDLNIIDYHNHLDPKEIYFDKPFENIIK